MGEEGGVPKVDMNAEETVGSSEGGDGFGAREAASGVGEDVGFVIVGASSKKALLLECGNEEVWR